MEKKKNLPNWIIKSFTAGKEDDDFSFWISSIVAFYFVGIVWCLRFIPCDGSYIAVALACMVVTLALLAWFYHWLSNKIELLKNLREQAKTMYKNAKTEKEKETSRSKLIELKVIE